MTAQRVAVTAGGAGIGKAIAEAFLETGAQVAICDVSEDALMQARTERPSVDATRLDVADADAVERWIVGLAGSWGGLDVLVNNAGVGGPKGPIEDTDVGAWRHTLDVNLSGAFFATMAAARVMKPQRAGVIINISTTSVLTGLPLRTAYIASKQGLMGLTKNTARELGPFGVRCNAILPGLMDNARGRALVQAVADRQGIDFAEAEASFLQYISLRTWIDPREIGDAAVFLASPKAKSITGQSLSVCGGVEWEG